jgi:hypothetical protein
LQLRERLTVACTAADRRLEEARAAAGAAQAARTPEEIEKDREFIERNRELFVEIGHPRSHRRQHPEVPTEIKDKVVVELLALLGADLGAEGEAILRRIGQHAASWLAPALEELFTGRALATHRRGFLAELTKAYYLDEEEDGSGFHEDGIRSHQSRSLGTTPLAAWYRGPFMPLFQTDFRNGVSVLNRMLNHATLARARTLAGLHRGYGCACRKVNLPVNPHIPTRDLHAVRAVIRCAGRPILTSSRAASLVPARVERMRGAEGVATVATFTGDRMAAVLSSQRDRV